MPHRHLLRVATHADPAVPIDALQASEHADSAAFAAQSHGNLNAGAAGLAGAAFFAAALFGAAFFAAGAAFYAPNSPKLGSSNAGFAGAAFCAAAFFAAAFFGEASPARVWKSGSSTL